MSSNYVLISTYFLSCVLLLGTAAVENAKPIARMEFVSCPGCKLNKLPQVKKFLKEVVEAGEYPGVTVNFIPGRVPELYLYDADGKEVDKMFIERLSFAELNTLVRSKGFRRKGEVDSS
ncbi:hypothetical protein CEUSTIGMA_g9533.t1 [Chlamydomonas eustigma]|uniref:Selenoprotein F/M domain-containing protein n=1 Tax=Chlamydomonas eustigma TaxID=1157962 RepID=A0A250XG98_9CHLO|nr:hypothetical protein CEUSTIGMA_g9533.t1 [Chlamydomonas eustigma]|eukprot:GAX82105.1 hypothetical protein CEUSTIGMA_g9533.t1 [Chlamydomonas eustigma]